jgi:hypothetical protein
MGMPSLKKNTEQITAFPLQQYSCKQATMLCDMHNAYLVSFCRQVLVIDLAK